MSRSGYSEDCEHIDLYRANVDRAIAGKRGQAFLREMAAAMDAMPEKVLIAGQLINADGQCCAIGTVCQIRNLDVSKIDYDDPDDVAKAVGISRALAAEIEFENDDDFRYDELTNERRWERMRKWITENLRPEIDRPAGFDNARNHEGLSRGTGREHNNFRAMGPTPSPRQQDAR